MKKIILIAAISLLCSLSLAAQDVTIRGMVLNKSTREALRGANILIEENGRGTSTDSSGFFSLLTAKGPVTLSISYLGYKTKRTRVIANSAIAVTVELDEEYKELEEVAITANADRNVADPTMGVTKLKMQTIEKMPAFMGEVDILKSVQLLPGVTSVGEGTTGLNVRGGNADQNLLIIDDAPVFNSAHLMGFISIFNPDVIDNLQFYRGGIPAQYGGRIASILETKIKTPSKDKMILTGGVGMVTSRLQIETPLVKDKLSFLAAGRIAYPNYLFGLATDESVKKTRAGFYDLTSKIDYKINDKSRVYATLYHSSDNFKLSGDSLSTLEVNASSSLFNWATTNLTIGWEKNFNERFYAKLLYVNSKYKSIMSNADSLTAFTLTSQINYDQVRAEFNFTPSEKHNIFFGGSAILYWLEPGELLPSSSASTINQVLIPKERAVESALYVSDEWKPSDKLSVTFGLRYSQFYSLGSRNVYSYEANQPKNELNITDTIRFGNNEIINSYAGFEPRLGVKYALSESASIKIGYQRMYQYIQQISNTTAALPTDRWQLSTQFIKPQIADQYSVGFFKNFVGNKFETSVEVYYKDIQNATDYKDGVNLLLTPIPETAILQGEGRAYGLELMVKKNIGRFTGWSSYTYSQTLLRIDGDFSEETINKGQWYEANYNKPHNLNITTSYKSSYRTTLSTNFTFSTGRPVTYPDDKYLVGGIYIPNYTGRNQNQIPSYHRLDFSVTVEDDPKKVKKWKGSWVFSVYNVYARKNAFSIFFKSKNNNNALYLKKANAYKLSVFGTIFPSLTYNFKF
jgi:ferric enterobactin receptor